MKILVLSNLYPPDVLGGYELGCRQAVEGLRAKGHEVRVLTSIPRTPTPPAEGVKRAFRLTDVWSHYLYATGSALTAKLWQAESHRVNAANVHALLEEIEDFQPDVAYPWMLVGLGGLGLMACLEHLQIPWSWHLMDDVPSILCRYSGRVVPELAREFGKRLHGRFISCSQQLVDEIEGAGVSLGDDVDVIPNWVHGPRPPVRRSYLDGGTLRIVSAAGLIERQVDKGMDVLVESAATLRELGFENFEVDIYGHATDGYIGEIIHRHGLSGHVRMMGSRSQSELAKLYANYDVFAFPTRPREPFGFAPLEAAYAGCVPVMSEVCGIAEWLVHGVHCLKAQRAPWAFAAQFAAILRGDVDLRGIGRRVASVVDREFHLDAILPRIEKSLSLAAGRPRGVAGSPSEAYRMAVLAEKLTRVLIHEAECA